MGNTSDTYKRILQSDNYWFNTSVAIGGAGRLATEDGDLLTFGGFHILTDAGGPENGYREDYLISIETELQVFADGEPSVGNAVAKTVDLKLIPPVVEFPPKARIEIYVQAENENEQSEWVPQGIYFIDTRSVEEAANHLNVMTIHGYDHMIFADASYPSDKSHSYPLRDIDMVRFIAVNLKASPQDSGIGVSAETVAIMTQGYRFGLPVGYTMRECLQFIAASYGGNFVINNDGDLHLILLGNLPEETRYLVNEDGYAITFGGTRILV